MVEKNNLQHSIQSYEARPADNSITKVSYSKEKTHYSGKIVPDKANSNPLSSFGNRMEEK